MEPEKSALAAARHILQSLRNELDDEGRRALETWLAADEKNRELFEQLRSEGYLQEELRFFDTIDMEKAWGRFTANNRAARLPRVRLLSRRLVAAALAGLLLTGAAWYWLSRHRTTEAPQVSANHYPNDLPPGGNRAVLTLSGGRQIILDSARIGTLTSQGGTRIIKLDSGRLAYSVSIPANGQPQTTNHKLQTETWNTLSTPRGGQYQLTLPDGSRVWLNAASSITYPAAFTGKQRTVTITGEAYLEVARNSRQPFIVHAGSLDLNVLGTSFNINAYADEPRIAATLIDGKISVKAATGTQILNPGQQAQVTDQHLTLIPHADLQQVLAWKNGFFSFTNADVPAVMRQLARWYNVDVVYEGDIPKRSFNGEIGRSLTLGLLLDVLASSRIHYSLAPGNKLIIRP